MDNQTFQIIITGATVLALLSFMAQGLFAFLMVRVTRETLNQMSPTATRIKKILAVEESQLKKIESMVDRASSSLNCAELCLKRVGEIPALFHKLEQPMADVKNQAAELTRSFARVEISSGVLIEEMQPKVSDLKCEAVALYRTAHMESRRAVRDVRHIIHHLTHLRQVIIH
ncbi:MAG: hypothetical protein ABI759_11315 [Candidatus Solibacter sp.]